MIIIFGSYCLYKLNRFFFTFLKDPAGVGAAIKKRPRLSAPTYHKIDFGSGAASKLAAPGGSGSAALVFGPMWSVICDSCL